MKNLLYKEFKLAISPLFLLISLLGALVLIPMWPYFIALMYFFFITVPNIFNISKAQNDIGFSVMLPVRKRDVVKSRILSIAAIELLHILVAVIFAIININMYSTENFLLDPNIAFFGFALIMFAIFNIIFFPMFYKTAYKLGIPIFVALIFALIFITAVELLVQIVPAAAKAFDGTKNMASQLPILAAGIVIFALANILAYKISAKRFEKIDL